MEASLVIYTFRAICSHFVSTLFQLCFNFYPRHADPNSNFGAVLVAPWANDAGRRLARSWRKDCIKLIRNSGRRLPL